MSTRERIPEQERQLRLGLQYVLALLPQWMSGDDEPTAFDVASVGNWDDVEAIRKRIDEIRTLLSPSTSF